VAQIALTHRRSAYGWGARLAAFLNNIGFALALGIAAIQGSAYEVTPNFWDGVDDDTAVPVLSALPNDEFKAQAEANGYPCPDVLIDGEVIEADPPRKLVTT
jgi:hypothetical protein